MLKSNKKKPEKKKKSLASLATTMLQTRPSDKTLKSPYKKEDVGKATVDYGGHQKALHFLMPKEASEYRLTMNSDPPEAMSSGNVEHTLTNTKSTTKVGSLSIGLVYEGDWKASSYMAGNGKRKMCQKSEEHLDFLNTIKEMLSGEVHPSLKILMDDTLRVNCLRGARTKPHTDSYKGNAPNFMFIAPENSVEDPGYLCYDVFPVFKHSVVKLFGQYFVPHSYSEASKECKCIGPNPLDPSKPIYYIFPNGIIDHMQPYGNLTFGIVGWKASGLLQIVEKYEDACLYKKSQFNEYTWAQVIEFAGKDLVHEKPRKRIVKLSEVGVWHKFEATMYRHWWCGNPMTLRFHAFFRTLRQSTPTANIYRKGKKINYVDASAPDKWYMHQSEKWQDINRLGNKIHCAQS